MVEGYVTSSLYLKEKNKDAVRFLIMLYSELFDICDINVVGEKCVWLQNKERIDNHNNTVKML